MVTEKKMGFEVDFIEIQLYFSRRTHRRALHHQFNAGNLAVQPFFWAVHRTPDDEADSDSELDYRKPSWQFRVDRDYFPNNRLRIISKCCTQLCR